jgi:hypothetical protein
MGSSSGDSSSGGSVSAGGSGGSGARGGGASSGSAGGGASTGRASAGGSSGSTSSGSSSASAGSSSGTSNTTTGGGVVPPGWNGDCGLHTQWAGDDRCILPPPPDKGFQLHVGPSNYTNPEATYVMQPGTEATTDFPVTSPNQQDRFFYFRQYRMRPTAHHMIITAAGASTSTAAGNVGHRIATANKSADFPVNGIVAPENSGVASSIAANTNINTSLHAINTGSSPQLREIWVNFWYKDAKDVTEPATPWFDVGNPAFSIAPGQDTVLGPYTCSIASPGRLLWAYGHRHANNVGFIINRVRGTQRDLVYAGFVWNEPITLQYDSITTNAVADTTKSIEGGWSGILDLKAGDQIEWSCHVINKQSTTLTFTNQTYLGEMCIVDAEAVGPNCQ